MKRLLLLSVLTSAAAVSHAQVTTLFNEGFESYLTGSAAAGQTITGGTISAPWSGVGAAATFTTSTEQANLGSKSLKIQRTAAAGAAWLWGDLNGGAGVPYNPLQKTIFGTADFFIPTGPNTNAFFGMDTYGDGANSRIGTIGILGDGRLVAYGNGGAGGTGPGGFFVFNDAGGLPVTLPKGQWNNLTTKVEYSSATSAVVSYLVNGVEFTGFSFIVSPTGNPATADPLVTDFDIFTTTFNTGLGGGASASAYVDNYKVVAIPEPATLLAIGIGLTGLLARRKKS